MAAIWQSRAKDILQKLHIELSSEQEEVFYHDKRIKVVAGGEGSSKSFQGALYGLCRALSDQTDTGFSQPYLVWVVGADFEDAHKECEYLIGPEKTWLEDLGIFDRSNSSISTARDQRLVIRTSVGITFETVSAYDPLKIGRDQPDGIIGCEVSRWDVEVWNRCYGRLARKHPRAWGWYSGSFETSLGWFPEIWETGQHDNPLDIVSFSMPSWANRAIYPGGYDDPAIQQLKLQTSEVKFLERYGGRPAPPSDSVLPEFRATSHITAEAEYDPKYPVYLFADPGTKVYAVLFVQFRGDEVCVVDEVYASQFTHPQVIRATHMKKAWAGVTRSGLHVMDIGGTQRHMGMQSSKEAWYDETGLSFFSQKRSVEDEVEKLRSVLNLNPVTGRPYLRIHPRCKGIISEMGGGPPPVQGGGRWIMKNGKPAAENDHSCKALAYGLLAHFGAKHVRGLPFGDNPSNGAASYLQPVTRRNNVPAYLRKVS